MAINQTPKERQFQRKAKQQEAIRREFKNNRLKFIFVNNQMPSLTNKTKIRKSFLYYSLNLSVVSYLLNW